AWTSSSMDKQHGQAAWTRNGMDKRRHGQAGLVKTASDETVHQASQTSQPHNLTTSQHYNSISATILPIGQHRGALFEQLSSHCPGHFRSPSPSMKRRI